MCNVKAKLPKRNTSRPEQRKAVEAGVYELGQNERLSAYRISHISEHAVFNGVAHYRIQWMGYEDCDLEDDQSNWQPESLVIEHEAEHLVVSTFSVQHSKPPPT